MDEPGLGKRPRDPRHRAHVARRLVAPARLALALGVEVVEAADGVRGRQRPHLLGAGPELLLVEAEIAPAGVLGDRADQAAARVLVIGAPDHLGDEVGLGRDRQLRVGVEHHPQQRRAGAVDADDERRRWALRVAELLPEPRGHPERVPPAGLSAGDHRASPSPSSLPAPATTATRGSVPGPSPTR